MSFFNKLASGAHKLFSKVGGHDPNFFRKVGNTARKIDNSVQRVGNFLASSATSLGLHPIADAINGATASGHEIRNNLERSIRAPINEVRPYA